MVELHLHLDGSLEPSEILTLAAKSRTPLPTQDPEALRRLLTVEKGCRSLGEYLQKFALPLSVLQSEETIEAAVSMLLDRLHRLGLLYTEIRYAPQLHRKNGLSQEQVVQASIRGLQTGIAKTGMPAQLILCCMRGGSEQENRETAALARAYLGAGVCALDLAGDEARFPTASFRAFFADAQKTGVPFVLHAGEAAGADSVRCALEMGAKRIGHGIRSVEDPAVLALLRDAGTVLETCFSSNLQTCAVRSAEAYPLPLFLREGIAATLCTDNSTVSGTDLRQEYRRVQRACQLQKDQLLQLAQNAVNGAFLEPKAKAALSAKVEESFPLWLEAEPAVHISGADVI